MRILGLAALLILCGFNVSGTSQIPIDIIVDGSDSSFKVINGASFYYKDEIYKLFGILSLSRHITCGGFECGEAAASHLRQKMEGHENICSLITNEGPVYDYVVQCFNDGGNIETQMVKEGWAQTNVLSSEALAEIELEARENGEGMWGLPTEVLEH